MYRWPQTAKKTSYYCVAMDPNMKKKAKGKSMNGESTPYRQLACSEQKLKIQGLVQ